MTDEEIWQVAWEATLLESIVFVIPTKVGVQPLYLPRALWEKPYVPVVRVRKRESRWRKVVRSLTRQ